MNLMLDNLGNVMDLVKKVQEAQQNLQNEEISSSSGDVMTVVVNGQQDIVSIEINPNYLSPENKLLLQDLLCATLNQAITKSRDLNQSAINKLTNDLNLPHVPGLF